jgi:hypothetical protein
MKKLLIALSFSLLASTAFSDWSSEGTLSSLRIHNGASILANFPSLSSEQVESICGSEGIPGQISVNLDDNHSSSILSMMLSAEMAERKVKVFLSGSCYQQRIHINGVSILKK